jgi:3-hydroxyacyl-CoA dehydrogenase
MWVMTTFRSVGVLGAGTMGAQIAAHFANAGVAVLLLDVTADAARDGLKRARALKPDPFFTPGTASLISIGGRLSPELSGVDHCQYRAASLARVEDVRRGDTIVSSNTSGIPIRSIAEGRSAEFRRHRLGTHFFNPPRYLPLVEVIPTADTDRSAVDRVSRFLDVRLGKGVVVAKDTPNFIANRIGLYGVIQVLRTLEKGQDRGSTRITGPALQPGKALRPNDGHRRTVLGHVVRTEDVSLKPKQTSSRPAHVEKLIERGSIGEKKQRRLLQRQKTAEGSEILTLDPSTMVPDEAVHWGIA